LDGSAAGNAAALEKEKARAIDPGPSNRSVWERLIEPISANAVDGARGPSGPWDTSKYRRAGATSFVY